MKTYSPKPENLRREWFLVDASGQPLGRLASEVARRLRGKHKPEFAPHMDTGDHVVVVNAGQVRVTGNKETDKIYHHHTGYPGGIKSEPLKNVRQTHPERIIEKAVKGMLPKNSLGRSMFRKLHVYAGPEHRHAAQQPKPLEI
jgi:large subunit ribosomal protein L13